MLCVIYFTALGHCIIQLSVLKFSDSIISVRRAFYYFSDLVSPFYVFLCRRSPSGVSGDSLGFHRDESDSDTDDAEDEAGTATVICQKSVSVYNCIVLPCY